jgi:hypothetical protein
MRCDVDDDVYVAVSTDGGATFSAAIPVGISHAREVAVAAGGNIVYIAATVWDVDGAPFDRFVSLVSSTDGGASWSEPARLSDYGEADDSGFYDNGIGLLAFADQLYLVFDMTETTVKVMRPDQDGDGFMESAIHTWPGTFHDLMHDGSTVVSASDAFADGNYYVRVSIDGAATFGQVEHSGLPMLGDWAAGGGRVYFAGSNFGDDPTAAEYLGVYEPAIDLGNQTQTYIHGLPPVGLVFPDLTLDNVYHRAVDADASGNAYVVTRLQPEPLIQLDRLEAASDTFAPPITIAEAGRSPGVAALPGSDGAAVIYTTDDAQGLGSVWVTVQRN